MLLIVAVLTQVATYVVRPTATYRAIELGVPAVWLGALAASFAVMPLELGVPAVWLGALAASFAVMPLGLALPSGALADRLGERRIGIAGGVFLTLTSLCFLLFGHSVGALIIASMLLGTGHLLCVISQQALVANTSQQGQFDADFGRYTFAASLGQAIGPGLIIAFGGGRQIPDTGAHLRRVSDHLHRADHPLVGLGQRRSSNRATRAKVAGSMRTLFRLPGLTRALITSCVILAAVDISLVYLPALGAEHQLSASLIGLLLALPAGASMMSRLFLGRLSELIGQRQLLVTATLIAAISTALIPAPMPIALIAVAVILMGLGLGVGQPVTMAWLAEASPSGLRGRSMSLRLVGNRTGQLVIPSAVGLVAVGLGSAGVLWVTAAALAAVAVSARRITQNPFNPPPPQPA